MKIHKYIIPNLSLFCFLFSLLATSSVSFGGNDPSIKGDLRQQININMKEFIDSNTVGDVYSIYDPIDGKLLKLTFVELHKGIVKKGDYYVSCADFTDSNQKIVDLDFLVIPNNNKLLVTQAVIHSVDGEKRKYHLEK